MLDPELRDSRPESDLTAPNGRAGTPFSYWLPSAPEKSKLSEGQSEHSKCRLLFSLPRAFGASPSHVPKRKPDPCNLLEINNTVPKVSMSRMAIELQHNASWLHGEASLS